VYAVNANGGGTANQIGLPDNHAGTGTTWTMGYDQWITSNSTSAGFRTETTAGSIPITIGNNSNFTTNRTSAVAFSLNPPN
jgi:hypothetical protein